MLCVCVFPPTTDAKFPRQFLSEVKQIYKRLFRLYAHLYCTHSEKIRSIGANAHLNTCFKHFTFFVLGQTKERQRQEGAEESTQTEESRKEASIAFRLVHSHRFASLRHFVVLCVLFLLCVSEFNLMDQQEMQPLEKLINKLKEAKAKKP